MNNTITYLNTAACGLLPGEFIVRAKELYAGMASNASAHAEKWRDQYQPEIKNRIASFLNAPEGSIALLPNFSWGINGIVQSLKGTEKVLMYEGDYPSFTEPFKINAFDITWVGDDGFAIDVDLLKQKIVSDKIDILAISHVQWMSGFKVDLKDLGNFCKKHNVRFLVDATQSIGAIPIDIAELNIDVLIASNYKWMNAGFGTGIMYVKDSFLEEYTPAVGGHNSFKEIGGEYEPGIQSYEPGHPNMYGFSVLDAAIKDKMERGVASIQQHNLQLAAQLVNEIGETGLLVGPASMKKRSSIVFLKDEKGLWTKMQEADIVASQRGGNIRISFHYYNTEADVQKLIDVVRSL